MERFLSILFISFIIFTMFTPLMGQKGPAMVGSMQIYKIEWNEDAVSLIPYDGAAEILPGDTLYNELKYVNTGNADAVDNEIISPIAEGMAFVPNSVKGDSIVLEVSIDEGKTYQEPPIKIKKQTDSGEEVIETITPDTYTHLKFKVLKILKPGDNVTVGFKTIITKK